MPLPLVDPCLLLSLPHLVLCFTHPNPGQVVLLAAAGGWVFVLAHSLPPPLLLTTANPGPPLSGFM